MPRGRRQQQQEEEVNEIIFVHVKPLAVQKHLNDLVWELSQKSQHRFECPICLEEINDKHSFCMTCCGHAIHWDCRAYSQKPDICCVCKYGFEEQREED